MAVRPVNAPISQTFGANPGTYARFGLKGHEGIDYAASYQPVYAELGGWVGVSSQSYGNYGQCIILRHSNGSGTIHAHLSQLQASVGQWVNEGQQIGVSGNSGNSSGPHEHQGYQPSYLQNLTNGYWGCINPEILYQGGIIAQDQTSQIIDLNARLGAVQAQVQGLQAQLDAKNQEILDRIKQTTDLQVQVEQLSRVQPIGDAAKLQAKIDKAKQDLA